MEQLEYAFDEQPPEDPVDGAVWFPRNTIKVEDDDGTWTDAEFVTGMWQWNGNTWGIHTTLTGMIIVPTEDGGQQVIGPGGAQMTQILADTIRTNLLYADVAGVKTLVIADIPRANLEDEVQTTLEDADRLRSRILLDSGSGSNPASITLALQSSGGTARQTYTKLTPERMTFVVEDEVKVYIDGPKSLLHAENLRVENTATIGTHQVRTIPGSNITTFQWVGR